MLNELQSKILKYLTISDNIGETIGKTYRICSNSSSVYILEGAEVCCFISKKYYMTIEVSKNTILDDVSVAMDEIRLLNGYKMKKFQFWIPSCIVKGKKLDVQYIGECYGVSIDLALDFMYTYNADFKRVYDKENALYFGLPLYSDFEEVCRVKAVENTINYMRSIKEVEKWQKEKHQQSQK